MAHFTHFIAQLPPSKNNIYRSFGPLLSSFHLAVRSVRRRRNFDSSSQRRQFQVQKSSTPHQPLPWPSLLLDLPRTCPGCGAFTQIKDPSNPGFYSINRKAVNAFVAQQRHGLRETGENATLKEGPKNHAGSWDSGLEALSDNSKASRPERSNPTPSIQQIVAESPHKYNHMYHVLDAADFPLSVIPQLQRYLSLSPQRSQNRRAKTSKFYHGRKAEMSFIITRSDLLAPRKEQVDAIMPYLLEVLREALGSSGKNVRLGNVRCVSSKRGWWTKTLKEDIWNRGGGGWMVGKVNVGKSNLFECIFPKGRKNDINLKALREDAGQIEVDSSTIATQALRPIPKLEVDPMHASQPQFELEQEYLEEDELLPPAPVEQLFPVMPIVSSIPGTTASPIRLLFGGGKGELIDLPGLSRTNLENYVVDEHKSDLVMQHRLKPKQFVLKPGQSLLLGCLIRITPITPGVTVLAYPFVPLESHVTSTEKAIEIHMQRQPSGVPSITKPGMGDKMSSAGTFQLKWDVTKKRTGPLTSSAAVGLNPKVLPFVVLSTDILIEGCGWIELVVQIRKRELESQDHSNEGKIHDPIFPTVEVFSPEGKDIGARRPMSAWLLGGRKRVSSRKRTVRPRRSMKGVKKALKLARGQQVSETEAN
ncbi:hypothetical protein MMC29_000936 [Sticta canariensis]|nr:hypothetical protein [Sticta canariensis]